VTTQVAHQEGKVRRCACSFLRPCGHPQAAHLKDSVGPCSLPSAVWLNTTSMMTSMPRLWHSLTSCLNSFSTAPPPSPRAAAAEKRAMGAKKPTVE
jgi:hypothetical protein